MNKQSILYHYITQLDSYLQEIDRLESMLEIEMDTDSKQVFVSDIAIVKELAQQRIQSAKGAKYKLFMNIFTKIENYYFKLKKIERDRNKDKYFWEV